MDLTPTQKLSRFCFIGSMEPVAAYLFAEVDVEKYLPLLEDLYNNIDFVPFIKIIKESMQHKTLTRYDEPIFALAAFFTKETTNDTFRKNVVRVFSSLVDTDKKMFLFLKYVRRIVTLKGRKTFPKSVGKAVKLWYQKQTDEKILDMWLKNSSGHTFNHAKVFKLFYIDKRVLWDPKNTLYRYCVIRQMAAAGEKETKSTKTEEEKPMKMQVEKSEQLLNDLNELSLDSSSKTISKLKPKNSPGENKSLKTKVSSKQRLASVKPENLYEDIEILKCPQISIPNAIQIIRKYKLTYEQVPSSVAKWASAFKEFIPHMSYLQLLKMYRTFIRFKYYKNQKLYNAYATNLQNMDLLNESDVSPINILMAFDKLEPAFQISSDLLNISLKKIANLACGKDQKKNIRMCIVLNLQDFYKIKTLRNHRNLTYYLAAITLAYGFFRREDNVSVLHWSDVGPEVFALPWRQNTTLDFTATYTNMAVMNSENKQNLKAPINYALKRKEVFDVFLCIGPKFTKSNPNNNSNSLYAKLSEYQKKFNPKAKMVLLSLLSYKKPSMLYDHQRNEHILEILGLDENTVRLIDDFAAEKFV